MSTTIQSDLKDEILDLVGDAGMNEILAEYGTEYSNEMANFKAGLIDMLVAKVPVSEITPKNRRCIALKLGLRYTNIMIQISLPL